MAPPPVTITAILALLDTHPDGLTLIEIADELGMHRGAVQTSIHYERQKRGSSRIRILRYEPVRGRGGNPMRVYVLGPGRDAPPLKMDPKKNRLESAARYRRSKAALLDIKSRKRRAKNITELTDPFKQMARVLTK